MTREERKRLAEQMYADGLTMQRIGDAFGVTKQCISKDLCKSRLPPPQISSLPAKQSMDALMRARVRRIAGEEARDLTGMIMGDPPVGFSALDRINHA